jgi:hypothetical protein
VDASEPVPQESALRPARSDLHPADPADDTIDDPSSGSPQPDSSALDTDPGADTLLEDESVPGDGTVEPADSPGDGTIAPPPEAGDADRLQTAERGREAEAARANTSDSLPVPTETPAH